MDRTEFRKRVLLKLISSPWLLLPMAAGITTLMGSWALGAQTPWPAFAGLTMLLGGVGVAATRWLTRQEALAQEVHAEVQAQAIQQRDAGLNDLRRRLQQDDDPRTERCLDTLRDLQHRYEALDDPGARPGPPIPIEVTAGVAEMVASCIASLERSLTLWETAQKMVTDQARQSVFDRRERILEEVDRSIEQLEHTLDGIHALGLEKDQTQKLATIRRELDQSLEVARRVEQRMAALEGDLTQQATERAVL